MSESTSRNSGSSRGTQIRFNPEPDVAEHLKHLRKITQWPIGELINDILAPTLRQLFERRDTAVLEHLFMRPCLYRTKEDALAVIERYDGFIAQLKADGDRACHDIAAPARTKAGDWEILFKETHPWANEDGEARYR